LLLAIVLPNLMASSIRAETATPLIKAPTETPQVGIAYATWHDQIPWGQTWDVPQLGQSLSTDPNIIRQHAAWLSDAKVDFIYIDWSNNLNTGIGDNKGQHRQLFVEGATRVIFDEYRKLQRHPQIVIMIGFPDDKAVLPMGDFNERLTKFGMSLQETRSMNTFICIICIIHFYWFTRVRLAIFQRSSAMGGPKIHRWLYDGFCLAAAQFAGTRIG
jgi:hypothetical protein